MYRLISALLTASDWLLLRHGTHVCEYLPDWLEPCDYRCICGARPNQTAPETGEAGAPTQAPAPAAQTPTPKKGPRP